MYGGQYYGLKTKTLQQIEHSIKIAHNNKPSRKNVWFDAYVVMTFHTLYTIDVWRTILWSKNKDIATNRTFNQDCSQQ